MARPTRPKGFTLVEIVFVLMIMGLLVVLARVSYRKYVEQAIRQEAYVGFSTILKAQFGYFADTGRYASNYDQLTLFTMQGGRKIDSTHYQGKNYTFFLEQPWGTNTFRVIANGQVDNDPFLDEIVMDYNAP